MRELVFEEPIVPLIIDSDQELQCYYSSVENLFKETTCSASAFPQNITNSPYPPQWQPSTQVPPPAGWGVQPVPHSYGEQPYPPQTSGYAPYAPVNPSYPANPQYPNTGYGPPQPPSYQPYQPYGTPGQYPPQQYSPYYAPQAAAYPNPGPEQHQYGYPSYPAYQQPPAAAPGYYPQQQSPYPGGPETITPSKSKETHASAPPSESPAYDNISERNYTGWSEVLMGEYGFGTYHDPAPIAASSPMYADRSVVNEAIIPAQFSTDHVNEYYSQQFEKLSIGWNI